MAEENNSGQSNSTQSKTDPEIQNLKSEFNRKMANLEDSNKQLLEAIKGLTPKAPPVSQKKVSDLIFDDTEAAVEEIETRVTKKVNQVLDSRDQRKAKESQVFAALYNDYPELADQGHDLTKKTVEIYNALPEEDRQSPTAYRLAAREAAMELGVKPKNKREASNDDYSFGGSSSGQPRRTGSSSSKEEDADIAAVAEAFGINMNDPKKKERVLGRKRSNWTSYKT